MEKERVQKAARRLCELKASGVELHEMLGGKAGVEFIRDHCEGDPDVAYAALALVYSPTLPKRCKLYEDEVDESER